MGDAGVGPVEVDQEDGGGHVPQEPTRVQEVVVNVPSQDVGKDNMEVFHGTGNQTI